MTFRRIIMISLFLIVLLGISLRFYHINQNQFVYYDEGNYLHTTRKFVTLIESHPPGDFPELLKYLHMAWHLALGQGKAIWFFLSDLRVYFVGAQAWYFPRVLAAFFGSITLGMVYLFAKRYFSSPWTGWLSLAMIAVFPSHIYYSRLGMQETLSALCFLAALYFYLFPKKLHWRTFLSGFLWACVFFTNYRMIVIPFLVGFCELYISLSTRTRPDIRKFVYNTLTFFFFVFVIGNLADGKNTIVIFAWIFHQMNLAQGHFDMVNLLSFPYYLFRLESIFFGLLFFGNIYLMIKKQWKSLLPFFLVCLQMLIFSFSQEKGVRYMCVVMPLMVIAAVNVAVYLFQEKKSKVFQCGIVIFLILMFGNHLFKGYKIMNFQSDYQTAMEDLKEENENVRVVASQNRVVSLYHKPGHVMPIPRDVKHFFFLYSQGYRYLIIGPQAYVSYTDDGMRFSQKLKGYLGFMTQVVPPYKVYSHFQQDLLERFVLEHNENLLRSMQFIRANKDGQYGTLKVYKMKDCILALNQALNRYENRK